MRIIRAVDLYSGAGGTTEGLYEAAKILKRKLDLTAVNHWAKAIEVHMKNHPDAKHLCVEVQFLDPREIVSGGHLDILVASPSCVFYSKAAGGKPRLNQKRSSPWDILNWLDLLDVESVLIENVPELQFWAPLDRKGHPIKSKKGTIYKSWIEAIRALGYKVEAKVLNAADYGAPTSRSRLFILAKKHGEISWPEPTHSRKMEGGKPRWRAAREIIDWSLEGESIFTRKKPLAPSTMKRIMAGLKKFGSKELQPFIVLMEHGGGLRDIAEPLPTITTAKGGSMALVDPFILSQASGGAPRSVKDPLPTIPTGGAHSLTEAFLVKYHEREKDTIAEPFILPVAGFYQDEGRTHNPPRSVEEPLCTITQRGGGNLVEAHILQQNNNSVGRAVTEPLPSMTTVNKLGLIESCLIQYNAASGPLSVDEPLPTISTRNRFGLIQPVINGRALSVRFRMLQPRELASAMCFPSNFDFSGATKTDTIKMVGNAVAVNVSKALCLSLLGGK